jgi:hypothetical protein
MGTKQRRLRRPVMSEAVRKEASRRRVEVGESE